MSPQIITEVSTDRFSTECGPVDDDVKFYKLQDLFLNYDSLSPQEKSQNLFRVRM